MLNDSILIKEVSSFIKRRFLLDSKWLDGNCYYFALILKERFSVYNSEIYYDLIDGHFVCKINNLFFDWSGFVKYDFNDLSHIVKWSEYRNIDELHYNRIVNDVIK